MFQRRPRAPKSETELADRSCCHHRMNRTFPKGSKIDLIILDKFDLRNSMFSLLTVYLVYLSTIANFNFQGCFEHSAHDFPSYLIISPRIHPRASMSLCKIINFESSSYKHCQVAKRGGRYQRCQSTHIRIGGASKSNPAV